MSFPYHTPVVHQQTLTMKSPDYLLNHFDLINPQFYWPRVGERCGCKVFREHGLGSVSNPLFWGLFWIEKWQLSCRATSGYCKLWLLNWFYTKKFIKTPKRSVIEIKRVKVFFSEILRNSSNFNDSFFNFSVFYVLKNQKRFEAGHYYL